MATTTTTVGSKLRGKVTLFDKDGNPGASYDEAGGIVYEVDNPDVASVTDEDADPMDCEIDVLALGTTIIRCRLDTRTGEDQNPLVLEGELVVEAGEATTGTFAFEQVQPPPPA